MYSIIYYEHFVTNFLIFNESSHFSFYTDKSNDLTMYTLFSCTKLYVLHAQYLFVFNPEKRTSVCYIAARGTGLNKKKKKNSASPT